jgi:3-phenylpropionate/trans-cinnamate dioxygenase ferredoxin reductase subunit
MARSFRYAIVGGGVAAATAAEAIRSRDPDGSLAIFSKEWAPPYQRPPLSKEFLQNRSALEEVLMFPAAWYLERNVDLFLGAEVTRIDPQRKTLAIDADEVGYEQLLLATGAKPRSLHIPGIELDGVFALRSYLDASRLRGVRASAQHVAILGSGFIGMEVAASLRSGGCDVTVITIDPSLYVRFGRQIAEHAEALFERHGVHIKVGTSIALIDGKGRVESVKLQYGRRFDVDAVLIGVGAIPDTALAASAGLRLDDGIVVDDRLRTSVPNIYAAGDVARFPGIDGRPARVEHFDNAYASGAVAGANMAGADQVYRYVPFFWSDVFELSFEFVGNPAGDVRIADGIIGSGSFILEYRENDRLCGALLAQRTPQERDAYRDRLGSVTAK